LKTEAFSFGSGFGLDVRLSKTILSAKLINFCRLEFLSLTGKKSEIFYDSINKLFSFVEKLFLVTKETK